MKIQKKKKIKEHFNKINISVPDKYKSPRRNIEIKIYEKYMNERMVIYVKFLLNCKSP
jgi:hypothetical protein